MAINNYGGHEYMRVPVFAKKVLGSYFGLRNTLLRVKIRNQILEIRQITLRIRIYTRPFIAPATVAALGGVHKVDTFGLIGSRNSLKLKIAKELNRQGIEIPERGDIDIFKFRQHESRTINEPEIPEGEFENAKPFLNNGESKVLSLAPGVDEAKIRAAGLSQKLEGLLLRALNEELGKTVLTSFFINGTGEVEFETPFLIAS